MLRGAYLSFGFWKNQLLILSVTILAQERLKRCWLVSFQFFGFAVMGKKAAAKLKKAKGAQIKKQAPAKAPKAKKAADVEQDIVEVGKSKKRERLDRRDSDEQAERYISRKLSHIPNLSSRRNAAGETVKQFIKKEMRQKRITQGRLSVSFSVQLWREFG